MTNCDDKTEMNAVPRTIFLSCRIAMNVGAYLAFDGSLYDVILLDFQSFYSHLVNKVVKTVGSFHSSSFWLHNANVVVKKMRRLTLFWTSFLVLTSLHHFSLVSTKIPRQGKWSDFIAVAPSPDSDVSGKFNFNFNIKN